MNFEFEIYVSEATGKKMVFIDCCDGSSGAEYPYETAEDIGKAIQAYLENYYPKSVETATDENESEDDEDEDEEE